MLKTNKHKVILFLVVLLVLPIIFQTCSSTKTPNQINQTSQTAQNAESYQTPQDQYIDLINGWKGKVSRGTIISSAFIQKSVMDVDGYGTGQLDVKIRFSIMKVEDNPPAWATMELVYGGFSTDDRIGDENASIAIANNRKMYRYEALFLGYPEVKFFVHDMEIMKVFSDSHEIILIGYSPNYGISRYFKFNTAGMDYAKDWAERHIALANVDAN